MFPRRIVIAGGGTAGWLAALALQDAARRGRHDCAITVVESSKIGTIGVGEGTTAVFRQLLRHLGLDEFEFLAATGATIKFGIRHRDWRRLGHSYDGPIDDPHLVAGLGDGSSLDQYWVSQGKGVGTGHLFQHLMTRAASPFAMKAGKRIAAGPFDHAFHFDQALAGQFLRSKATGVQVIDDQITGLTRDAASGDILSLILESGTLVAGDLFIDATGFRRRMIADLGPKWVSYSDVLPVNHAMPFWLDIPEGAEIPPVTLAWAQKSGWMWQIPTQGRYGCGYVYSDAHTSPDQAKAEIEAALGHEIHPRADIRIDAGRLDQSWAHNCVALGLSSSFLEPLEATSIHSTVVQLMLLTSLLDNPGARARAAFNAVAGRQVDDFRDFIRLHYVSQRRDSPFWCDVAASHPAAVTDKLAYWAGSIPKAEDFTPLPMGLPHTGRELHVPVLDGLGLLDSGKAKSYLAADPDLRARARKTALALEAEYRLAAGKALPHRAFLQSLVTERASS